MKTSHFLFALAAGSAFASGVCCAAQVPTPRVAASFAPHGAVAGSARISMGHVGGPLIPHTGSAIVTINSRRSSVAPIILRGGAIGGPILSRNGTLGGSIASRAGSVGGLTIPVMRHR